MEEIENMEEMENLEEIRKNWSINPRYDIFDLLFDNLCDMHLIEDNKKCIATIRKFLTNTIVESNKFKIFNEALIICNLNSLKRREYHIVCDKFGLLHDSDMYKNIHIRKPINWNWEFSSLKPEILTQAYKNEQKERDEINRQNSENKRRIYFSKKTCYGCNKNGYEVKLLENYARGEIYCDKCIETEIDEYSGHPLNAHSWEPLDMYYKNF